MAALLSTGCRSSRQFERAIARRTIKNNNMEQLLQDLRHFYVRAFVPSVIFFIACYVATRLMGNAPLLGAEGSVIVMIALLGATFVAFVVTWFMLRSARAKAQEAKGEEKYSIFARAYRARIVSMSVISALASVAYVFTVEANAAYIVIIASLLILLYYPSETFVGRQIGEQTDGQSHE